MREPAVIAVTGPDGSGKSTLCARLSEALGAAKLAKHLPKNMSVPSGVDFFVILGGDGL